MVLENETARETTKTTEEIKRSATADEDPNSKHENGNKKKKEKREKKEKKEKKEKVVEKKSKGTKKKKKKKAADDIQIYATSPVPSLAGQRSLKRSSSASNLEDLRKEELVLLEVEEIEDGAKSLKKKTNAKKGKKKDKLVKKDPETLEKNTTTKSAKKEKTGSKKKNKNIKDDIDIVASGSKPLLSGSQPIRRTSSANSIASMKSIIKEEETGKEKKSTPEGKKKGNKAKLRKIEDDVNVVSSISKPLLSGRQPIRRASSLNSIRGNRVIDLLALSSSSKIHIFD